MIFAFTLLLLIVVHSKKLKPTHWGFAIFVLAVTIFTAIYFTPSDYWDRLKSVTDTADTAMARRKSYITVASGAVKRHPIIGSGTGTFRDIYATTDYARMYTGQSKPHYGVTPITRTLSTSLVVEYWVCVSLSPLLE